MNSEEQIVVDKMYYTRCVLCGALNDWTDTRKEANRNRKEHVEWHEKGGLVLLPHPRR